VSSGGLGVELDARYADVTTEILTYRGTLEVSIELPDDGAPINATAEVRWVERSHEKEGSVIVGLRFLDLSDAEHARLAGFVKDLVSRQYREKILGHYEGKFGKS
jgi:c-di-GMP-binding flagellar brake protein YcgR